MANLKKRLLQFENGLPHSFPAAQLTPPEPSAREVVAHGGQGTGLGGDGVYFMVLACAACDQLRVARDVMWFCRCTCEKSTQARAEACAVATRTP